MALEKLHGTQIVTWQPPLPQRAFQILATGVTSDNTNIAGLSTDGKRYGYFAINTVQWSVAEGFHTPPIQAGEQFQIWQNNAPNWASWVSPPVFGNGNALPSTSNPTPTAVNSPDLYNVYCMTQNRELGGASAPWVILDATVRTVVSCQQSSSGAWYVYYSQPSTASITTQFDAIVTIPKPYNPRYLGQIGHVSGINYTYSLPGGPDQLTAMLQVEPNFRTDAINPGRIVTAHRGASCIWEGQLTEPVPQTNGWQLTANGVGTYGTNFGAWWQTVTTVSGGKGSNWKPDGPVDFAIARGLRWLNRGIGSPAGIYTGPTQNPGSLTVTDFMNLLCTGGSLVWELVQPASAANWPPGPWELKVYNLPTDQNGNPLLPGPPQKAQITTGIESAWPLRWKRTDLLLSRPRRPPDLLLVNTSPVGRTIVADYNTIILYYQATPDTTATSAKVTKPATFATTFVDNPASVAAHGRMEFSLDISNAGVLSQAAAQKIGLNVLSKYIRANFTSAFNVQPGQLLNPGGFPVDLGVNWLGAVCTIMGVNAAVGGEVSLAPITFIIGQYQFDDDTQTASVTPYQNVKSDIASVIASLYPGKFA